MAIASFRRWLTKLVDQPLELENTPTKNKAQLALERLEGREVPAFANTWTAIGPAPQLFGGGVGLPSVSGRISSIATDPVNPNRYFVTAASGGVWRTLDGGVNWVNVTDNPIQVLQPGGALVDPTIYQTTPFMSSVSIAPSNPNTIYVATGEYDTSQYGRGILKSTDGGEHWVLNQGPGGIFDFGFASRIVTDRANENIVFMTMNGLGASNGVWRTIDGGITWEQIFDNADPVFALNPGPPTSYSDLQVDPTNPNVVYMAVGNPTFPDLRNGIYRSSNAMSANPTWSLLIGGSAFVPGALPSNIKLSIAQSQPSTLYAALARFDPNTGDSPYLATYKTTDSGVNWTNLVNAPIYAQKQGNYNLAIAVSPTNPNLVFAGGDGTGFEQSTNLIVVSNDGGITWRDTVADPLAPASLGPHTDLHALTFDKSGRLLLGCDGGAFRLNNASQGPPFNNLVPNWVSLNGQANAPGALNTIQFVGVASHPTDGSKKAGGSQDNGVALYNGNIAWTTVLGGDAGETIWDPDRPNNIYRAAPVASVGVANYISKSSDGGLTWAGAADAINATPGNTEFYPPIIMDPSNSLRLFTGTDFVWATDDGAVTWKQETKYSPTLDVTIPGNQVNFPDPIPDIPLSGQSPPIYIDALGVGRTTSFIVIYVSQGGFLTRIFLTQPPPQPTSEDWVNITPPGSSSVNRQIVVDPANPAILYVLDGDIFDGDRIYRSDDFGASWTVLDGAGADQLPELPAHALGLDPRTTPDPTDDILYVGNDNGVWGLVNPITGPFSWFRVGDQTQKVMTVHDIDVNTTTGNLNAGSYGRGLWDARIRGLIRGSVYEDINGNGINDGETGLVGLTVRLLDATPGSPTFGIELATTITGGNGIYEFPSLRMGNYQVVVVPPSGLVRTTGDPLPLIDFMEQSIAVPSYTGTVPPHVVVDSNLNFGFFRTGTISGIKFNDLDGDGVRDANEPGLSGFRIYNDLNGNGKFDSGEPFSITSSTGAFSFTVQPTTVTGFDSFVLREVQQSGFTQTTPNPAAIPVTSNLNLTGILFGNKAGSGGGQPPVDLSQRRIVVGMDAGQQPTVRAYDSTGVLRSSFFAYSPAFRGGVRVATADFTGDGVLDFVTGAGPGGGPHVRLFDGSSLQVITEFFAFDSRFANGIYVAAGDVTGDGVPEIVVGAGQGGGPHVRVFDAFTAQMVPGPIGEFFAYSADFRGGVRVAVGDTNHDGFGDVITGAGPGGGPHVVVWSGENRSRLLGFFAYSAGFRGGVYVSSGDMNFDGVPDVITGAGEGGGAHVAYFNGTNGMKFREFFPYPVNTGGLGSNALWTSGVRVSSISDVNNDGLADLIVGPGPGRPGTVKVIDGATATEIRQFTSFDPSFLGGIYVGSA